MEDNVGYRRGIGRQGEDIACKRLAEMGHVILERNWRSGHLEIDIISSDSEGVHFIEVKTRSRSIQAPPQESVDRTKQKRIARAAQGFLKTQKGIPYGSREYHFDVMAVTFEGDEARVEWFPQAYIPLYI